jgi:hypothetical protein
MKFGLTLSLIQILRSSWTFHGSRLAEKNRQDGQRWRSLITLTVPTCHSMFPGCQSRTGTKWSKSILLQK